MKPRLTIAALALMIIGDILTSFAYNLELPFWNIGVLIKFPLELLFLLLLVKFRKFHFVYFAIGVLVICWFIGTLTGLIQTDGSIERSIGANFIHTETPDDPWGNSFTVLSRYLLFFAIMPMLLIHIDNEEFLKNIQRLFEYFLYANSIAIIIGYVFKIPFFSSYNPKAEDLIFESRFGYKGLLYGINETTGVFFLGIAHIYREFFINHRKRYSLLCIVFLAALLTGTKGCIISLVLLTSYYLFKFRRPLFFAFVGPIFLVGIIYLIQIDFVEKVTAFFNIYMGDDFSSTPIGAAITLLMTGRNIYIYNNWLYMKSHWVPLNFLFGDGLLYSETDFFDLVYFFGLGSFLYLYIYMKLVFYKYADKTLITVFIFLLILAFTGGHIMRSAVFPIFFSLFLIIGYRKSKSVESTTVELKNLAV